MTVGCITRLNPPRPHGRGQYFPGYEQKIIRLKSTPPTRAGTNKQRTYSTITKLKSTPPTRAGTTKDGYIDDWHQA